MDHSSKGPDKVWKSGKKNNCGTRTVFKRGPVTERWAEKIGSSLLKTFYVVRKRPIAAEKVRCYKKTGCGLQAAACGKR
jgi:hypothetical protein